MSGYKALAEADGAFVVVWPQGLGTQWGSTGADLDFAVSQNAGKDIHSTDDVGFLTRMLARIVAEDGADGSLPVVDAERIFATGFSMGCMMAHRLALERSHVLAGFGCHGGTLNGLREAGAEREAQAERFDLQPMPAYMTGGSEDEWYSPAPFEAWGAWNGKCQNL